MTPDAPAFPPLLNGIVVEPGKDTASVAVAASASGTAGAGDLFWSRSQDRLNMSVVLEPEVALQQAVQMLPLMAVAFGDAFGAVAPPEISVHYRWPGDILVNGAKAGGVRLIVPQDALPGDTAKWMVLSLDIAVTLDLSVENPGEMPGFTTLHEEGAGDVTSIGLLESVSRHFLTWLDTWTHDGFKDVHTAWCGRAFGMDEDVAITHCGSPVTGRVTGMDEDGNLLFRREGADTASAFALLEVAERHGS